MSAPFERRNFLKLALATGAGVTACATVDEERLDTVRIKGGHSEEAAVTPGEDLMQEHGALQRVLLIYDEAARLIALQRPFEVNVVAKAAAIVHGFVEEYHEANEEQFVFPRLQAHQRESELVTTLFQQHRKGPELTRLIAAHAN